MSSFGLSTPIATILKENEKGTTSDKPCVEKRTLLSPSGHPLKKLFARIRRNICLARLLKVRLQVAYRGCTWMSEHTECS